ncbi:MAG: hypothetical protein H0T17_00680 [Propionibacteriales bacterium]|nr:hypothetical protein [Propionibacteriales bacterium]
MRSYDDVIDVRRGLVAGQEAPEQFLWRGRLWVVRDVLAHWVETGAWWEQAGVAALLGIRSGSGASSNPDSSEVSAAASVATNSGGGSGAAVDGLQDARLGADLLGERDVWRVEAGRGRLAPGSSLGAGVFDLAFDWVDARWRLVGCMD